MLRSGGAIGAGCAPEVERGVHASLGIERVAADLADVVVALVEPFHGSGGPLQIGFDLVEEREPLNIGFGRHGRMVPATMRRVDATLVVAVVAGGFLAGLVDAMVGGGGLIQLPVVALALPDVEGDVVLGTNKFAAATGTAAAARNYRRRIGLPRRTLAPAIGTALVASFVGARLASLVPSSAFRPGIVVMLIAMAAVTIRRPDLGQLDGSGTPLDPARLVALSAAVGLYDGIFGPGTGMLFTFGLVLWLKMDFLLATGTAKILNLATNVAALWWFIPHGAIRWVLAVPLAIANLSGGIVGSRLALSRGTGFVRRMFLVVVAALILRLAWQTFR